MFDPFSDLNITVRAPGFGKAGAVGTLGVRIGRHTDPDGERVVCYLENGSVCHLPTRGGPGWVSHLDGDALATALRAPHILGAAGDAPPPT